MNLFELFVKIGVDDQASGKLKDLGGKLGNGLKTAAKIGTAAVGAAAAGITALTTAAVNNYAEYEQLVGGVDTLFKDASQKVQKYASEAYRTSGMSANDYMANATAFSASLISALGDDTEAAAEYANRAMVSMSDNANKMGTSLDSIVQTYQSLSRGNMAMLDNLKLGYGGTKAELERLIKDAASYTDVQKEMGITVDESSMSFDNIVNAIAVVQGKLGIAGATADEAGTTIEGAVNSMKSAWQNLITGLADGNADIEALVNNLVTTIVGDGTDKNLGVLGNIRPAIETALNGASTLISTAVPKIVEMIPQFIKDIIPKAVSAVKNIISSIAKELPSIISAISDIAPDVISAIEELLPEIISAIGEIFPELIALVEDVFPDLVNLLLENIPSLLQTVFEALPGIIESLGGIISEIAPTLVQTIVEVVRLVADNIGAVIDSIIEVIPVITEAVNNAILDNFPSLLQAIIQIVLSIIQNLPTIVEMLVDQIGPIVNTIVQVIVENLPAFISGIVQIVWGIIKALPSLTVSLARSVLDVFKGIGTGIANAWPKFKEAMVEIWGKLTEWIGGKWQSAKTWGKDLIDNFISGIKAKAKKLKEAVSGIAQTVKDFIGFSEPKKGPLSNFHTYAPDMMDLFAKGIRDNEDVITDQIEKSFDFGERTMKFGAEYGGGYGVASAGGAFGGTSIGNITINIDGAKYSNEQSLAEAVAEAIQSMTDRRAAVYA